MIIPKFQALDYEQTLNINNSTPMKLSDNIHINHDFAMQSTVKEKRSLFDKVVVIEVYSSFDDIPIQDASVQHELLANSEAGVNLAKKFHPLKRYIWSINPLITNQIIQRCFQDSIVNLGDHYNANNPLKLTSRSKVIIVAQGNINDHMIADLEEEAFIEMLEEDLEIKNVAELEFIVCRFAKEQQYLQRIKDFFRSQASNTKIVAYKTLLSVNLKGDIIGFGNQGRVYQQDNLSKIRKSIFSYTN